MVHEEEIKTKDAELARITAAHEKALEELQQSKVTKRVTYFPTVIQLTPHFTQALLQEAETEKERVRLGSDVGMLQETVLKLSEKMREYETSISARDKVIHEFRQYFDIQQNNTARPQRKNAARRVNNEV